MITLKFTDGEEFDLSGSIRKECRKDGWYVLGEGKLIPVKDEQTADEYILKLSQQGSTGYLNQDLWVRDMLLCGGCQS